MQQLTHLSLFSGIGGIDLAAEWAGFNTVAFCEQNDYCQKVLTKHWPGVPIYDDVRTLSARTLVSRGIRKVKIISGGFPCQDVSLAGARLGLEGQRSTLWGEYARLICEIGPEWVLVENVPGLLSSDNGRFFARILRDLAESGYDAEWGVLSAAGVGAPHLRERVFIVAYPKSEQDRGLQQSRMRPYFGTGSEVVAHSNQQGLAFTRKAGEKTTANGGKNSAPYGGSWWEVEPTVGRVANGVPGRVDRLRALGNAVVPQQVYPILKAIADYELGKEQAAMPRQNRHSNTASKGVESDG